MGLLTRLPGRRSSARSAGITWPPRAPLSGSMSAVCFRRAPAACRARGPGERERSGRPERMLVRPGLFIPAGPPATAEEFLPTDTTPLATASCCRTLPGKTCPERRSRPSNLHVTFGGMKSSAFGLRVIPRPSQRPRSVRYVPRRAPQPRVKRQINKLGGECAGFAKKCNPICGHAGQEADSAARPRRARGFTARSEASRGPADFDACGIAGTPERKKAPRSKFRTQNESQPPSSRSSDTPQALELGGWSFF